MKVVMMISKQDAMKAAGSLKACAGQEAGAEAAIQAVQYDIFKDHTTETVLLIDAENAFNAIKRKAMLHNISVIYPIISTYISNCYNTSVFFVHYWRDRNFIKGRNYTRGSNSDGSLCFRNYTIDTSSSRDNVIQLLMTLSLY